MNEGNEFVLLVEAMRKAQIAYEFKRQPMYAAKRREKEKRVDKYILSLKRRGQ